MMTGEKNWELLSWLDLTVQTAQAKGIGGRRLSSRNLHLIGFLLLLGGPGLANCVSGLCSRD